MAPDFRSAGSRFASAGCVAVSRLRALPAAVLVVAVAGALSLGLAAPTAAADSLSQQRTRIASELAATRGALTESSRALTNASAAVDAAQSRLAAARAQLARTQTELSAARSRDVAMAAKLKQARADLAAAKAAVAKAQKALDDQVSMAGTMVRSQVQQQTNLMPIAVLMENTSTADLQTRLQWSTTMFDTTAATIDDLTSLRAKLAAEKARQADLTAQVAVDRSRAADNLSLKKRLERSAETQAADVAVLVGQKRAAEKAAAGAVEQDRAQYAKLTAERATVEHRIAVRIAQAKAKAAAARQKAREAAQQRARQAAAERSAAKAAAAARKAARAAGKPAPRRAAAPRRAPTPHRAATHHRSSAASSSRGSSSRSSGSSGRSSAHHGFIYPVNAPITSPFGMRLHPVTHVWKLHDGTDFGAGCGTPIRAAYSGRVAERYYNGGYGNRLMIDHGMVNGRYVTTGYNHAIRYVVSVGQHVGQGQVIGYVGTTGYSTGCHLHLMVWVNGSMVNPMTWY